MGKRVEFPDAMCEADWKLFYEYTAVNGTALLHHMKEKTQSSGHTCEKSARVEESPLRRILTEMNQLPKGHWSEDAHQSRTS
jgi:hypothetical protein